MTDEGREGKVNPHFLGKLEHYGEPSIASFDAKIPKFLLVLYVLLPIWGIVTFYCFWNGSAGWLDRGSWHELQIAAHTTLPVGNEELTAMQTGSNISAEPKPRG